MASTLLAIKAYTAASDLLNTSKSVQKLKDSQETKTSFAQTLSDSLTKVNTLQHDNMRMIEEFASGKSQNVHELMISLQKAGLAMDMTSAVRNKVMQAYQELMRIQF